MVHWGSPRPEFGDTLEAIADGENSLSERRGQQYVGAPGDLPVALVHRSLDDARWWLQRIVVDQGYHPEVGLDQQGLAVQRGVRRLGDGGRSQEGTRQGCPGDDEVAQDLLEPGGTQALEVRDRRLLGAALGSGSALPVSLRTNRTHASSSGWKKVARRVPSAKIESGPLGWAANTSFTSSAVMW